MRVDQQFDRTGLLHRLRAEDADGERQGLRGEGPEEPVQEARRRRGGGAHSARLARDGRRGRRERREGTRLPARPHRFRLGDARVVRSRCALLLQRQCPPQPVRPAVEVHHVAACFRAEVDCAPGEAAMVAHRDDQVAMQVHEAGAGLSAGSQRAGKENLPVVLDLLAPRLEGGVDRLAAIDHELRVRAAAPLLDDRTQPIRIILQREVL